MNRSHPHDVRSRDRGRMARRRRPGIPARDLGRFRPLVEWVEDRQLLSLTINPTFDSSITSDPSAATIEATINRTIAAFESFIADDVTVNITFKEVTKGLGGSSGGTLFAPNYQDYYNALKSHETSADDTTAVNSIPNQANDPINGQSTILVKGPLARALGFNAPTSDDGTISLNTSICNLDRTSVQDPTKYDLQAVTAHEIDEILGSGSRLDNQVNGNAAPTGPIKPLDLFRYSAAGTRSFDTSASTTSYFSIDGGTTNLVGFNQFAPDTDHENDFGDWFSNNGAGATTPRVQDSNSTSGAEPNMGVELTRLDVLGFKLNTLDAPVVTAAGGQTATEGASQSIDLGSFTDPDAAPWGVTVSWGDGSPDTTFSVNTAGALGTKPHTYAEEGSYVVTVTVTDFTSQSQTKTFNVTVSDPKVVATGGQALTPVEGQDTGSVLLATFTDPGGPEATGDYSADIDWGDGTGTQVGVGAITLVGTTFQVRGSHAYAEESAAEHPGSNPYTITITIHHDLTVPQMVTSTATVSDPHVVAAAAAPIAPVEGMSTGSVLLATFTDPGGPEATGDYSADIDWGDGTGKQVGTGSIVQSGTTFEVFGTHTYAEESAADHPGSTPYVIAVTIHHETSAAQTVTTSATVSDPAVVATGGFSFIATEGVPSAVQTVATFTDPGGPEALGDYKAMIDWGDGTAPSQGTITFSGGVYTIRGSHTFAAGLGLPDDFGNTLCDAAAPSFHKAITVTISHETAPAATAASTSTISLTPGTAHLTSDGNLIVVGTPGADQINVTPVGNSGSVRVALNSGSLGSFTLAAGGRIIVAAMGGDDDIQVAGGVRLGAVLYGGPGNDRIKAGGGPSILIGCDGNDDLTGGNSDDLLVGGDGSDSLNGTAGDDILVASNIIDPVTHAEDVTFSHLVAALGGSTIVFDDDGSVDVLNGASGDNVLDFNPEDVVHGKQKK